MTQERAHHWDTAYQTKSADKLSWFEASPDVSLAAIARHCEDTTPASFIDIGGGMSRLAPELAKAGCDNVAVLDISAQALDSARAKAGELGERIDWICADITTWHPPRKYQMWHDRAVFHFLVDPADQGAYRTALVEGLEAGGLAIIATFALDGPEKCSGLPVQRYSPSTLHAALGDPFDLVESWDYAHPTPGGSIQHFNWCVFRKGTA